MRTDARPDLSRGSFEVLRLRFISLASIICPSSEKEMYDPVPNLPWTRVAGRRAKRPSYVSAVDGSRTENSLGRTVRQQFG